MRINDIIYFSPSVKIEDLDIKNQKQLLSAFYERITSYYLIPIKSLVDQKHAFASGTIECLLIEAFARYSSKENGPKKRIVDWCEINLGVSHDTATDFYKFFRCGLLHESHIKNYGQFCFDENEFTASMQKIDDFIIVNPAHLLNKLQLFFSKFIEQLKKDEQLYDIFLKRIKTDFQDEVERAKREKH